jgi:DNA (cytosine-5)-methyltransferase 1
VFVVGCLGDWTAAAEVLAIREGLQRNLEASGKTRKVIASDVEVCAGSGGIFTSHGVAPCLETTSNDYSRADGFTMIAQPTAGTLGNRGLRSHTELDGHGAYMPVAQPVPYDLFQITAPVNRQNRKPGDPCHTLARDNAAHAAVAHAFYSTGGTHGMNQHPEVSPAVKVGSGLGIPSPPAVAQAMTVRRLTPRECERLQGFPDDWTLIPWRGKAADQCPDGPRYKALGNSMACNCMAWIGERIAAVHSRHDQRAAP